MKTRTSTKSRSGGRMGLIMAAAPIVLELLIKSRAAQKKKGRYTRARKRDHLIDTVLAGAHRAVGGRSKRRWF